MGSISRISDSPTVTASFIQHITPWLVLVSDHSASTYLNISDLQRRRCDILTYIPLLDGFCRNQLARRCRELWFYWARPCCPTVSHLNATFNRLRGRTFSMLSIALARP